MFRAFLLFFMAVCCLTTISVFASTPLRPYELILKDKGYATGVRNASLYYPISEHLMHEATQAQFHFDQNQIENQLGLIYRNGFWPITSGRFHIRILANEEILKLIERLKKNPLQDSNFARRAVDFYYPEEAQELMNIFRPGGGGSDIWTDHEGDSPTNEPPFPEGPRLRYYLRLSLNTPFNLSLIQSLKPIANWPTTRGSKNWCSEALARFYTPQMAKKIIRDRMARKNASAERVLD